MATISENLQTIADSTSAIKQAIIDKGGDASGDITTWADAISGLSGGQNILASVSDINFYDYDGTILYSYTKEQFLAISDMPYLPIREGLICQGWNWALADAKACVADCGKLNIGAMYITDDGDTRLYVHLTAEEYLTIPLYWNQSVSSGVGIDWGDGSAVQTVSGTGFRNTTHTYAKPGDYVIRLKVSSGTLRLGTNTNYSVLGDTSVGSHIYRNILQKVEIGRNVEDLKYAFQSYPALTSITIPSGVTSIGDSAFSKCYILTSITIPSGVTSIGGSAFSECHSLTSITIPSGVTSIGGSAFYRCSSLTSITIPSSVISIGNNMFHSCYALASVTVLGSITSISRSAFRDCYSLTSITIPSGVTSIGDYAFCSCYSIPSITIPSGVTSIDGSAFYDCRSLTSITIPSGVTIINDSTFSGCSSLTSITIPSGVTSIGGSVFYNCDRIKVYDFTNHTSVPTLSNTNAFGNIPSSSVIKVPASLVDAWKSATNWSTYASHIVAG